MTINIPWVNSHKYIIMVVDYFTKWAKAMPMFDCKSEMVAHLFFNHVILRFGVPKQLVSNHGKQFEDVVWTELSTMLKFEHQYSSSYYPQGNGQVEAVIGAELYEKSHHRLSLSFFLAFSSRKYHRANLVSFMLVKVSK